MLNENEMRISYERNAGNQEDLLLNSAGIQRRTKTISPQIIS
jgi:hypothetical protein